MRRLREIPCQMLARYQPRVLVALIQCATMITEVVEVATESTEDVIINCVAICYEEGKVGENFRKKKLVARSTKMRSASLNWQRTTMNYYERDGTTRNQLGSVLSHEQAIMVPHSRECLVSVPGFTVRFRYSGKKSDVVCGFLAYFSAVFAVFWPPLRPPPRCLWVAEYQLWILVFSNGLIRVMVSGCIASLICIHTDHMQIYEQLNADLQ